MVEVGAVAPKGALYFLKKVRQFVPVVADQHAPRPRDDGRRRPVQQRAGEGGAPPASRAVQPPGTISFRKVIIGDRHKVNKLTVGVNPTLEESKEDVDKADGDQQGDPVGRPNCWYTGGDLCSGSISDVVRRGEAGLPSEILPMRVVKSSSSLSIDWPPVVSSSLFSPSRGDVLFSLDPSGCIPATLKQLSLEGMANWFRSQNPARTSYPSNSANIGCPNATSS